MEARKQNFNYDESNFLQGQIEEKNLKYNVIYEKCNARSNKTRA